MEEVDREVLAEAAAEVVRLPPVVAAAAAAAVAGPVRPAIAAVQRAEEVVSHHLTAAEGMVNHLTALITPTIITIPMAVTARTGILAPIPSVDTVTAFHPTRCIGPG